LEHWAIQMPQLERVGCGTSREDVLGFSLEGGSWESIERKNFLFGYGTSQFCCLEETAHDIFLPGGPRWKPENSAAMKEWIYGFLKFDGRYEYIDIPAMRSNLMSERDY